MNPRKFRPKHGPEYFIQRDIMTMLRDKGWYVINIHGSKYQSGLPDLYATHSNNGHRWIEVKNPKSFVFTPAQLDVFPKLTANGTRIWILTAATETEYNKLFGPANWSFFLKW